MIIDRENAIPGWHFLDGEGRLLQVGKHHGRRRVMKPGLVLHVPPPVVMCERGLHSSRRPLDALYYASGDKLCVSRVLSWGEVAEQPDKLVAEYREVVSVHDCTAVLHEFACLCAEDALALDENPDPRSIAAIAAKRAWLAGELDNKGLAATGYPAWAAAWLAARAARAAARAAWAATGYPAEYAAGDAAWDAQNKRLEEMLSD